MTLTNTNATTGEPVPESAQKPVEYSLSGGFVARLGNLGVSIAFTSYQSGILYFVGRRPDGGAHVHQSHLPKPMGLAVSAQGSLTLASGAYLMTFENVLAPHERINDTFDACYVPRSFRLTGDLDMHDVGVDADGTPVFVNTRFNCLATASARHSFRPTWKPPFISGLLDGDKCHLNGVAMRDGRPSHVTAVSRSDVIDGWRDRRADGGVVIDVETNATVCEGLSMPHSPRFHRDELWLLNSGTGDLGVVEGLREGKGRFGDQTWSARVVLRVWSRFHSAIHAFVGGSRAVVRAPALRG